MHLSSSAGVMKGGGGGGAPSSAGGEGRNETLYTASRVGGRGRSLPLTQGGVKAFRFPPSAPDTEKRRGSVAVRKVLVVVVRENLFLNGQLTPSSSPKSPGATEA